MQKLRIFVASPSDMAVEHAIVRNVATSLKRLADYKDVVLEVIDWSSVVPAMGRPEQVILDQIMPTSWDIFVGVLWHRFGTSPGGEDPSTHKKYLSGTEEEFKTAYRLWQKHGKPRMMMYLCKRNIPPAVLNTTQFDRVKSFFSQFDAVDGEHPGLYTTFTTSRSFEKIFHDNLQGLLIEFGEKSNRSNLKNEQQDSISDKRVSNLFAESMQKQDDQEQKAPSLIENSLQIPDDLEPPTDIVEPNDRFYIERDADQQLKRYIVRSGQTVTIQGVSQTGKSSLLVSSLYHARSTIDPIYINLRRIEYGTLSSGNYFLKHLASIIAQQLKVDVDVVNQIWREKRGPQDKLVKIMEDYILPECERQVVLAIDDADYLLDFPYHSDFFALMRSWHNNRAIDLQWNKLNIAMVIATEPYLLISNPNQSPFNVGVKLNLEDFNQAQVRDLNDRQGHPIKDNDFESFYKLLHGHPYLTRVAFYFLIKEHWTVQNLIQDSVNDQGPFGNHLINQFEILWGNQLLQQAFKQVIRLHRCNDDNSLHNLIRAGFVIRQGDEYYCRCELYERFFQDTLL